MTPAETRACFPGLRDKAFLDAACISLAPVQAREVIRSFLELAVECPSRDASEHHIAMDLLRKPAVQEAARLLNTTRDHIALVESTSHGLALAALAIPLAPGDNVLVADTEFVEVGLPWARRPGVTLRAVRSGERGALRPDDFEAAVDARTRVVCVSSVQWSTGYRVEVAALARLCRARGLWLVVDAIQEMGALRIDLAQAAPDFVVAGGHKWLNAPFGCGILYVGDRALRELEPPASGYLALPRPHAGWKAYFEDPASTPYRDYTVRRAPVSYETSGTANYPGWAGLAASLALVNQVGIEAAERRVLELAERAAEELTRAGARIVSHRDPSVRSGITTFTCYADAAQDRALAERLIAERVYVAVRYTSGVGGIRVSTHYFNDEEDLLRLGAALRRCRG